MPDRPNPFQKDDVVAVWNQVSVGYDQDEYWRFPENRANLGVILHHCGDPAGKRIIEVGCGSGQTTLALARQGARCALLDLSPVALSTAVAGFTAAGLPAPEQFNEDALQSTVPTGTYDLVWNGGVIEHFVDDGKRLLLREMLRMCAPGGVVLVLVPNRLAWQFQLRQAWQKLRGTWKYGFEDDMSPGRIRRMAEGLGFTAIEAYAFNPIAPWRWIPKTSRILSFLGVDTLEHHMRRTPTGMVTVLAIRKPREQS